MSIRENYLLRCWWVTTILLTNYTELFKTWNLNFCVSIVNWLLKNIQWFSPFRCSAGVNFVLSTRVILSNVNQIHALDCVHPKWQLATLMPTTVMWTYCWSMGRDGTIGLFRCFPNRFLGVGRCPGQWNNRFGLVRTSCVNISRRKSMRLWGFDYIYVTDHKPHDG